MPGTKKLLFFGIFSWYFLLDNISFFFLFRGKTTSDSGKPAVWMVWNESNESLSNPSSFNNLLLLTLVTCQRPYRSNKINSHRTSQQQCLIVMHDGCHGSRYWSTQNRVDQIKIVAFTGDTTPWDKFSGASRPSSLTTSESQLLYIYARTPCMHGQPTSSL